MVVNGLRYSYFCPDFFMNFKIVMSQIRAQTISIKLRQISQRVKAIRKQNLVC